MWASLALRAISTDGDPSTTALFTCAAVVLAGFALGAVTWLLAAPQRAKRSASEATALREMQAPFVMLGIAFVGIGASPILDASPGTWGWTTLIGGSLVGGLNLGLAFIRGAEQAEPSDPRGAAEERATR